MVPMLATQTIPVIAPDVLIDMPDQERRASRRESYAALLARLSRQSVSKHFDAYADVDWDAPENAIEQRDPRWELAGRSTARRHGVVPRSAPAHAGASRPASDRLAGEARPRVRARAEAGLLEFASTLDDGRPEFRYAYHEVIEEAQHSLMFRELLERIGLAVPGLGWFDRCAHGGWRSSAGRSPSSSSCSSSAVRSRSTMRSARCSDRTTRCIRSWHG